MNIDSPILETLERDWGHGVDALGHLFRHPHHHQTPAPVPATMAAAPAPARTKENRMSLQTLEDDVKTDLTQGLDWLEGFVGRVKAAAPGIIATSEAVAGSTVGQLAEIFLGKILPPDVEAELLTVVRRYVTTFGQPAAPVQPQPSFQPAGQ